MVFPRLIKQSEGLKKIPNPEDFGLDKNVASIFANYLLNSDFIKESPFPWARDEDIFHFNGANVLDYAKQIIYHPETDVSKIKNRQEILETFSTHKELTDLIFSQVIKNSLVEHNEEKWIFKNRKERARQFLDYMTNLAQVLPETSNSELETFRKDIVERVQTGERFHKVESVVEDVEKKVKLNIQVKFTPNYNAYSENYSMGPVSATATFASGNNSDKFYLPSDLGNNFKYIFDKAVKQIKKKRGKHLNFWKRPCELEIIVDEESKEVSGKLTYGKFNFLKSLKTGKKVYETSYTGKRKLNLRRSLSSFEKVYDPVETEINVGMDVEEFSRTSEYVKRNHYQNDIGDFRRDICEFGMAVTELRYFAMASNYFNQLKEDGVSVFTPEIIGSSDNSQTIAFEDLIEPNLICEKNLEKIVANNVFMNDSSKNLFVITGPNNNGKTTYMNAIGIAQAEGQAGLNVLAKYSMIKPKDNIYTHYVQPGDLQLGESRFAHDVSRGKKLFEEITANSLVLVDEIGTGTDPRDGVQWAEDALRTLGDSGATTYFVTHFHTLSKVVEQLPFGRNLYCLANADGKGGLIYTYQIHSGSSDQSNGMYLVKKMGADRAGLKAILDERVKKEGLKLRE